MFEAGVLDKPLEMLFSCDARLASLAAAGPAPLPAVPVPADAINSPLVTVAGECRFL